MICSALSNPPPAVIEVLQAANSPAVDAYAGALLTELEIQDACFLAHPDQPRPNPNVGPS